MLTIKLNGIQWSSQPLIPHQKIMDFWRSSKKLKLLKDISTLNIDRGETQTVCSLIGFSQPTVFFSHKKPAPANLNQHQQQPANRHREFTSFLHRMENPRRNSCNHWVTHWQSCNPKHIRGTVFLHNKSNKFLWKRNRNSTEATFII